MKRTKSGMFAHLVDDDPSLMFVVLILLPHGAVTVV